MPSELTFTSDAGVTWAINFDDPIGEPGSFGTVYRGGSDLNPEVAIKVIAIDLLPGLDDLLLREQDAISRLIGLDLPHVLKYIDYGSDSTSFYLVMEIADLTLKDHLSAGVPPEPEAVDIMSQLAKGLAAIHTEAGGMLHRDLKPDNILLADGQWKLADFSIARLIDKGTLDPTFKGWAGAPRYRAPEVWLGQSPLITSDLYSLGCVFHEILIGSPPFNGSPGEIRRAHIGEEPGELEQIPNGRLRRLVSLLLRKTPSHRPQSATEVLDKLAQVHKDANPMLDKIAALAAAHESAVALQEAELEAEMETQREFDAKVRRGSSELLTTLEQATSVLNEELDGISFAWRDAHTGDGVLKRGLITHELGDLRFGIWGRDAAIGSTGNVQGILFGDLMGTNRTLGGKMAHLANLVFEDSASDGQRWLFYRFQRSPLVSAEVYKAKYGGDPHRQHGLPSHVFLDQIGHMDGRGLHVWTVSKILITLESVITLYSEALEITIQ